MSSDDHHAPGQACCLTCERFAGREPPPTREAPLLRLRPDEAVVRVRVGPDEWRDERPGKAEVVIGRSPGSADVVIKDMNLSRQQFRLRFLDQGVEIEDAQSTCGTYVDGRAIRRELLREGSTISVGDHELRVERA